MQNYLSWQLIIERVNSLSRRFKDARARYRKVGRTWHHRAWHMLMWAGWKTVLQCVCVCVCADRLSMGRHWRMLGGGNASATSRAAWRTQLARCTCVRPSPEKVNEWWVVFLGLWTPLNQSDIHNRKSVTTTADVYVKLWCLSLWAEVRGVTFIMCTN